MSEDDNVRSGLVVMQAVWSITFIIKYMNRIKGEWEYQALLYGACVKLQVYMPVSQQLTTGDSIFHLVSSTFMNGLPHHC
jgi:hypothetical protein